MYQNLLIYIKYICLLMYIYIYIYIYTQATKHIARQRKIYNNFQCCIYYRSNKHFGYDYFMYSMYVPILYIV